jgi:hypothetical protein
MSSNPKRNAVIGYVAYSKKNPAHILGDGSACLVVGAEETFRKVCTMQQLDPADFEVRKARFEQILMSIYAGGEFGFDEEAYARFAPLGALEGIPVQAFDFTPSEKGKIKFLNLKGTPPSHMD